MNRLSIALVAFLIGAVSIALPAEGKKKKNGAATQASTEPSEQKTAQEVAAQEAKSAETRATSIVSSLEIDDTAKAGHVHDVIAAQYEAIHDWHAANDAARKALPATNPSGAESDQAKEIQASYQALHDHFITALSAELTPEQIDKVKEKMTGGQMTATLRNYPAIVPNLTDDEMVMIEKVLLEARDDAMDSASKTERVAIFKKYKGKINNYLNAHGHNVAQAYKDWGAAQKAKQAGATSQPEANSSDN